MVEESFAIFEILTWLPDFRMGMNPFGNVIAWPVGAEATPYIRNNTVISSSILCQSVKMRIKPDQNEE